MRNKTVKMFLCDQGNPVHCLAPKFLDHETALSNFKNTGCVDKTRFNYIIHTFCRWTGIKVEAGKRKVCSSRDVWWDKMVKSIPYIQRMNEYEDMKAPMTWVDGQELVTLLDESKSLVHTTWKEKRSEYRKPYVCTSRVNISRWKENTAHNGHPWNKCTYPMKPQSENEAVVYAWLVVTVW